MDSAFQPDDPPGSLRMTILHAHVDRLPPGAGGSAPCSFLRTGDRTSFVGTDSDSVEVRA